MTDDNGHRPPAVETMRVRVSVGSTLLVIGAVVSATVLLGLFQAARRPLGWLLAASVVAWLLYWVVGLLDRWVPRGLALLVAVLGFVILAGGTWVGVRATLQSEVDRLRVALPAAAHDLEQRYAAAADFKLADRAQAFVTSLDDRFGAQAQVAAAAGTASTYVVAGVLMLFLLGYGPRFVSAGLNQIADPVRRETVTTVVHTASGTARAYLLVGLAQTIAITAICSVVFYLLDLPAPFVLGLVVGWLGVIPYFGIVLGGLAPLLAAAADPHAVDYIVLVALLVGLQLVEALVIRPRVDRRTVRVGPALILIGTLVGFELYGFGGALYGTAALVLLWAILQAMPEREATRPTPAPPPPTGDVSTLGRDDQEAAPVSSHGSRSPA